jgi:HlyD family secretion protein
MKRLVAFLVFAVIAGVVALLLTTLPANHETIFPGYMEADLVLVGSEQGGRVETLSVDEGDSVEKDAPIFTLESTEQIAEVAAAKARVAEAEARLADARQQMQRPREIEVLEASLAQAKAMLVQSNLNLDRTQKLFDKNWVSKAQLDAEPVRASLHTGQTVNVSCDGCQGELTAIISFIARDAEFTPPVIFSQEQRQKLVFLVEARPTGDAIRLTAGQPVTVTLGAGAQVVQR